jgi:hypothetical protein
MRSNTWRDIEEIMEMLIPQASPAKDEIKAVQEGRKQFARGEVVEWSKVRQRVRK